ncbi:MAG: NosD domain-containing protein, partial [Promethearchaeota archaeon]
IGIYLYGPCYNNKFNGNVMEGCGFYSQYSHFLSNTIDTTNLVNGGHLYFYLNSTGLDNDDLSNAGQIYLINCNNSIISNLDLSDGSVSISLTNCNNIEISHNNLSSNNWWGIELSTCDKISIIGNIINENHDGIEGGLTNSIILENDVNENYMDGIAIGGHNNIIIRNNIKNNGYRGLDIRFFCENNTILDNNIENNVFGAFLVNSFSNISENVISGNIDTGLYLGGGSNNNTIFLNFFRDNGVHIDDNGLNNRWNNSEIGNYWDNYTGIDGDGDGIGDIPHNISSSPLLQDYLPIVDNDVPEITILSPSNNSIFGNTAPNFIVSVKEKYIDEMWYTLDNGLHNYSFTINGTINQAAWSALSNGSVLLGFYISDKAGNVAYEEIIIIKNINNNVSQPEVIPGYELWIIIFVISLASIIFHKKVKNKEKENYVL